MKEAQKDGFTQEDIAYMFGVQQPVVSLVLRNSKSHVAA